METDRRAMMLALQGRRVSMALAGGSRIDDCMLISAATRRIDELWVFLNGQDVFVPLAEITEIWEAA
jgi:hypothetical protein